MELLVVILLIAAGAWAYDFRKKKIATDHPVPVQPEPTPQPEPVKPEPVKPEPVNPEPVDPCKNKRDGTYNPKWDRKTCNAHGYFWCTVVNGCLNKSIDVIKCGENHP